MESFFDVECVAPNTYIVKSRTVPSAYNPYPFVTETVANKWIKEQTEEIINNAKAKFRKRHPAFSEIVCGKWHPKMQILIKLFEAKLLFNHFN